MILKLKGEYSFLVPKKQLHSLIVNKGGYDLKIMHSYRIQNAEDSIQDVGVESL
jgi:hypothetical protein